MFLIAPTAHDRFVAQIRLANGRIAGEGFGRSKKTAMYLACLDAVHNGYAQIALEHAQALSIQDENAVRVAAQQPQMNPTRRKRNPMNAAAYRRPKRVNERELLEMQEILQQCGYNTAYAEILQREGMGPHELKDRLRFAPGEPGSLEYTHGYRKRNPLALFNPLSQRGKEMALGIGLLAGVVGLAMLFRGSSAAAATPPTPVPTPPAGGGGAAPPPAPTTHQAFSATEADSGKTFNMNVGDTLTVTLATMAPIANYQSSTTGANAMTSTAPYTNTGASSTETWTAASSGTEQLSYLPVDLGGAQQGNPVLFTVVVA